MGYNQTLQTQEPGIRATIGGSMAQVELARLFEQGEKYLNELVLPEHTILIHKFKMSTQKEIEYQVISPQEAQRLLSPHVRKFYELSEMRVVKVK
jgi:hypothetical protein